MKERIGRAKAMMAYGAVALADIAEATGFFDQAHLTRVFKFVVGVTPGAWMKSAGSP